MPRTISPDGLYHTVDERGKAPKPKYEERIRKRNEDAEICGTCTRKKCSGTPECAAKRRKELERAGKIPVRSAPDDPEA